MDTPSASDTAEKLRAQIARMVAGNGTAAEAVVLTGQHTTPVKLNGVLEIRLTSKTEMRDGKGPAPQKWDKQYTSLAEITPEIIPMQNQLAQDAQRLQRAATKILARENNGWGIGNTEIALPELDYSIGTQFTCSGCNGTQNQICGTCNGKMRQSCGICYGKRQASCPTCSGRGVMSSGENCAACRTHGVVDCAACQGTGETACTHCVGKGQVPCRNCDARGVLWHQVIFHSSAVTNFQMNLSEELPEDILRHVRRLSAEGLTQGRATITQTHTESGKDFIRLHYTAEFPIALLQIRIGEMPVGLTTLGHKGTLLEVPNFMDALLSPSLEVMRRARTREIPAVEALQQLGKTKFFRVALSPGPNNQKLRRYCPFGISPAIVREVPRTLHYLISILTERPRMLAAVAFNAVAAILLLYVYVLNAETHPFGLGDVLSWLFLLALNGIAILTAHYLTSQKTLLSFGIRPKIELDAGHLMTALGRTGSVSLGVTLLFCVVLRLAG